MKGRIKISSVRSWIIILLILLVVVNSIAFYIYHISHPSEILCIQGWRYLESGTFKILTASIILPSLLFLLEVLFKIGAKRKEEHEERQWECLEKTSQMWNQLFSLASEVRYFEKDANKGARIEDILLKLAKFIGPAEDVPSMWYFRFFRDIKDIGHSKRDIMYSFLLPINVLLRSTLTVAYFIRNAKKEEKEEILWLQSSLERIQEGITDKVHQPIIGILKNAMYLEESGEKAMNAIRNHLKELKEFNDWLRDMEKNNKLFPSVEGNEVEEFRKAVEKMWYEKAGKESGNLKGLFFEIPPEKRPRLTEVWFSTDYVKRLADEITYEAISRSRGP